MKSQRLASHQPKSVSSEWFSKCQSEEEKEELKQYLLNSSRLFDLLKGMLQKRYDSFSSTKVLDYDSKSWAYKQAHLNGVLQALEDIHKLLP